MILTLCSTSKRDSRINVAAILIEIAVWIVELNADLDEPKRVLMAMLTKEIQSADELSAKISFFDTASANRFST